MQDLFLKKKRKGFRFPIAAKLTAVTTTLLFSVTTLIALKSSQFFEKEIRETHQQSNQIQAVNRKAEFENLIEGFVGRIRTVSTLMTKSFTSPLEKEEMIRLTFKSDKDLIAIQILQLVDGKIQTVGWTVNDEYLKTHRIKSEDLLALRQKKGFPIKSVFSGKIEILNSTVNSQWPVLTLGIPYIKDEFDLVSHVALADIRLDPLQSIFNEEGASTIFLTDSRGQVMAHPRDEFAFSGLSLMDNPLVGSAMQSDLQNNHLPSFRNPDDKRSYYGVYHKSRFGPVVFAQVPEEIILEPAKQVKREAFYIGGLVLSAALFIIFMFSLTLTSPIEKLLGLTFEISKGNFNVEATKQIKSLDEVGDLATAFDGMTMGLKALVRTQGADVARELIGSDLDQLGGTKKKVTVLFSDLRDFTKFSEGHTPEEVVSMLNEYFEVMVACIEKNKGRVNKFIGDAIMAMWGAPSSTGQDEVLAVQAALDMRVALDKLNNTRKARQESPIKIGVGLHCGEAVAGTIGSKSRLEYTIIGDTVNQASRLEASTKAFGTDLILSEELVQVVKEKFICQYVGAAEVKGKTEPLKMFRIHGYIDKKGQEVVVETAYSQFESESADKVKIAA